MYPFEINQTNIQYHTVSSPSGDGRPLRPNPSRRLLPPRRRPAAGAEPSNLSTLTSTLTTSALDPVEP
jgi:hypothetical protein